MESPAESFDLPMPQEPPPPVQWRSWPLVDNLAAAAAVLVGLVAAGAGVRWMTGQTHLGVLAVAALGLAMRRFFVPALFELNTGGVSQRVLGRHRRVPWAEIRCYEVHSTGVLLLAQADPAPIDVFRGLYLPWGKHRERVLAQVGFYLGPPAQT